MPNQVPDPNTKVPVVEFDPRTGTPLFPSDYYKATEQQYKDYDTDGNPKGGKQTVGSSTGTIHRGKWLSGKLQSLYNDDKFKTATPEKQQELKKMAYEKWVTPYYNKVMKSSPPSIESFMSGGKDMGVEQSKQFWKNAIQKDKEHSFSALKESAHIMGGISDTLAYLGHGLDFLANDDLQRESQDKHPEYVKRIGPVEKFFKSNAEYAREVEQKYQERINDIDGNRKKGIVEKLGDKIPALVTDGVFFEATGGAKVTKALQITAPKTAGFVTKRAIDAINGATDFAIWNASIGESIKEGAEKGPVYGLFLNPVFRKIFQFGGQEAVDKIVTKAVENASAAPVKDTVKETAKATTENVHPVIAKATQFATDQLNKASIAKFNKPFNEIAHIQKIHIINRLLAEVHTAKVDAKIDGVPKEVIQAASKEEEETINSIFPEAQKAQQSVDTFIKQNGQNPTSSKFLATLPHHETTVDSSWRHLQGRTNFLKSRLRSAKSPEEANQIREALNDEYRLMKQKKSLEDKQAPSKNKIEPKAKGKNKSKGTVGSAAANDAKVFKNDGYTMVPVEPQNRSAAMEFVDWQQDSFALGVAKAAKQEATAKGQKQSFLQNAILNSYTVGASLSKKARLGEGVTKQLYHPQYGLVGGLNYQIQPAYSLGEQSGFNPSDKLLYINWLGARPNVVARIWNAPGVGSGLFLEAAQEAGRNNLGMALIPYDESKSFYEKMGMKEVGSYMVLTPKEVKNLLKDKGLMLLLLGAGITYGASQELRHADTSVKGGS